MANEVRLRGNTTREPNVFRPDGQTPGAFLHLAADPPEGTPGETLFTSVICFGEERVATAERLGKGSRVEIYGHLRANITERDGVGDYELQIVGDDIRALDMAATITADANGDRGDTGDGADATATTG